jgi:hypothetical protein
MIVELSENHMTKTGRGSIRLAARGIDSPVKHGRTTATLRSSRRPTRELKCVGNSCEARDESVSNSPREARYRPASSPRPLGFRSVLPGEQSPPHKFGENDVMGITLLNPFTFLWQI